MLQLSFGSGSSDEAPENPVTRARAGGRAWSQKIAAPRGSGGGSISRAIFALRLRAARLLADSSLHALPEARAARSEQRQETVPRQGTAGVGRQQQPVLVCRSKMQEGRKKQVVAGGSARGRALEPDEGTEEEEVWIRRDDFWKGR